MGPRRRSLPGAGVALAALILAMALGGCAQSGGGRRPGLGLSGGRPMVGTLRTSLSRLEAENDQLRRDLADGESDRRRLANRVDQLSTRNEELAARLNDARGMLGQRDDDLDGPSTASAAPRRPTTPAARPSRKAPFTQIPNRIDVEPPPSPDDDPLEQGLFAPPSRSRNRLDPDAQSQAPRRSRLPWLPVARGSSSSTIELR